MSQSFGPAPDKVTQLDDDMAITEAVASQSLHLKPSNELAIQAQNGCAAAFNALFERYQSRLILFLQNRLQDAADVEDVTQETLTKAWQALPKFDPKYQFTTWLYTIAVRTAADHRRRQAIPPASPAALAESVSPQPTVESTLETAEAAAELWRTAKRLLSVDQYSALWLRYSEELSVREIARILHRSSISVRVALCRGRAILRDHTMHQSATKITARASSSESLNPQTPDQLQASKKPS